jgi:hypothetical protein
MSRNGGSPRNAGYVVVSLALLGASPAVAEEPARSQGSAPTQTLVAGPEYAAGGLHRMLFGAGYRDLWTTPIEVQVLDLAATAGGLTPRKKGGGKETRSLRLKGQDGHEWRFRSVDKDPSEALPKGMRGGISGGIAQDQISAAFPVGALLVDPLAEAAGILHVSHRLVVMPDDPRLGEFRKEFAGMLGILEERPGTEPPAVTPGFERYDQIVDTEELEKRLAADPRDRIDARAFLRARLFDAVVGDYDRHDLQWDWARNRQTGRYEPVPKDRDLAFVRFSGLAPGLARLGIPRLVKFDEGYPGPLGLMWQARFLDRRHLSELDWSAWEQIVGDLQARLTGPVIDEAVARMPAPYYARSGPLMAARLKHRVALLPDFAWAYYATLAREAEVYGTDEADTVQLSHLRDGSVEVALSGPEGRYFDRTFKPAETREVRIFAMGGNDRAISEGGHDPGVKVRLIGGDGDDSLDDSAGGHTRFYDSSGDNRVLKGSGTENHQRPYTHPLDGNDDPVRDWGGGNRIVPYLSGDRAYGALLGLTYERLGYGFRKHPWGKKQTLHLAYATSLKTGDVMYEFQTRRADSQERFDIAAAGATGLEVINYYGFGNETSNEGGRSVHDVRQLQLVFKPAYRFNIPDVDITVGPVLKYSATRLPSESLIAAERPYGVDRFGQAGGRLNFTLDHLDRLLEKPAGALVSAEGNYYAPVWNTTTGFGEVHGLVAAFVKAPMPLKPTLAVRAGGRKTFGRYPLNEAAFIGGRDSVRGLAPQRYAGDYSAFGGAELRFLLLNKDHGLFSRFGVFGLADGGRVWLEGESSDRWHTSVGAGLWLAFLHPKNCISVSAARSEGDTRVYLDLGRVF